jgi:hypothetical protein
MKKNYKAQAGSKLGNMEKERNVLLEEKKKWDGKKTKEQEGVEIHVVWPLKVVGANKKKVKMIRKMCDEWDVCWACVLKTMHLCNLDVLCNII